MQVRATEFRPMNKFSLRVMLENGPSKHKLDFNIRRRVKGFSIYRSILPYERFLDNRTGWYD